LSLFFHHHSIGDNLHPLSPLKTLFRGKFVLRNEYLLESEQVALSRIGAKIAIFCKFSPPSASFRNPKIDYFLRFSTQIFPDFWPQATPSIGRRPTFA
jgi:hypothetical protein